MTLWHRLTSWWPLMLKSEHDRQIRELQKLLEEERSRKSWFTRVPGREAWE